MTSDTHQAVLLEPALEALNVRSDGLYIDGTYGRGGHSAAILERLGEAGRLWLVDRDPEAVVTARARHGDDPRCRVLHARFDDLPALADEAGVSGAVDGLLLDLGVSSPQLDDGRRGFSFRREGPLDMRMDPDSGPSAAQWLEAASPGEMMGVFRRLGEERHARRIALAIVRARDAGALPRTTAELAELVRENVPRPEPGKDPATRVFQAIRIHVNDELGAVERLLAGVTGLLAPAGRLVVISFHSLEDRLVKRFMRDRSRVGALPPGVAVAPPELEPDFRLVGKPRRADADECALNPRARSAVMRVAERLA